MWAMHAKCKGSFPSLSAVLAAEGQIPSKHRTTSTDTWQLHAKCKGKGNYFPSCVNLTVTGVRSIKTCSNSNEANGIHP
jgi:hypothetical protein